MLSDSWANLASKGLLTINDETEEFIRGVIGFPELGIGKKRRLPGDDEPDSKDSEEDDSPDDDPGEDTEDSNSKETEA